MRCFELGVVIFSVVYFYSIQPCNLGNTVINKTTFFMVQLI